MAFILFLSFRRNQKQESNFQQAGGLVTRNISVLFIASRGLLQSHAEFNRTLYRDFVACYSCSHGITVLRSGYYHQNQFIIDFLEENEQLNNWLSSCLETVYRLNFLEEAPEKSAAAAFKRGVFRAYKTSVV